MRSVKLASGFSVGDYTDALKTRNRDQIAEAIHRRFTERYLGPVTDPAAKRHGVLEPKAFNSSIDTNTVSPVIEEPNLFANDLSSFCLWAASVAYLRGTIQSRPDNA
jgi:hypothetical protein